MEVTTNVTSVDTSSYSDQAIAVAAFMDIELEELPDDIERLIDRAENLIDPIIINNYSSSVADDVTARSNAIYAQVEHWINNGEGSGMAGIKSFGLSKLSINYGDGSSGGDSTLAQRARAILLEQGLLYAGIRSLRNAW